MSRTNFNLRGHKSEKKLVRWNEPYQKLATCDSKGVIYVWVKYEGRWSIELINDRGNCVSDFAWSHDGRMAVICYQDGFVLVGSVSGQRYWSHLYDLATFTITTATWTPNDLFLLVGLSNGSIMVIDENGLIVSKHSLKSDSILSLAYNCPKFTVNFSGDKPTTSTTTAAAAQPAAAQSAAPNLSASITNINNRLRLSNNLHNLLGNQSNTQVNGHQATTGSNSINANNNSISGSNEIRINSKVNNNNFILACSFKSHGLIYLLKNYDDLDPCIIDTKLEGVKFEWSNCE
jgi:hypothetical protein